MFCEDWRDNLRGQAGPLRALQRWTNGAKLHDDDEPVGLTSRGHGCKVAIVFNDRVIRI